MMKTHGTAATADELNRILHHTKCKPSFSISYCSIIGREME
jgi:hypothetical protein